MRGAASMNFFRTAMQMGAAAPMPFVIGLLEEYLPDFLALPGLDEVLLLHLDQNRLSSTHKVHEQVRRSE